MKRPVTRIKNHVPQAQKYKKMDSEMYTWSWSASAGQWQC